MARRHLDAETLSRLAVRDLDRNELEAAAWHLYKCRRCRGRVRRAAADGERLLERLFAGLEPTDVYVAKDYSAVFANVGKAVDRRLDDRQREDRKATEVVDRLLARPREERRALLSADPGAVSWSLASRLLEACRARWSDEPAEAEELAMLALEVCTRLPDVASPSPGSPVHEELRADLAARCWAYVGNCRRIRADLQDATRAFEEARQCLARGTGDAAERARVLDLEASLLRARRRFEPSERMLEEAVRLYRSIGDERGEARALVKLAITLGAIDEVRRAVEAGRRALELIDGEAEPLLCLSATFNLLLDLYELGGEGELDGQLEKASRLIARHGSESHRRRLRWFRGMVARDRGQWEEAERLLREVRQEYVDAGFPYEAGSVSLDLAVLCLEQGRMEETRQLAREMLPIFESRDVQREALATLMLFRESVLADEMTAAAARKMTTALHRGRTYQPLSAERPS